MLFVVQLYHADCFVFRPDGEKKAYVRLAPDYDALDVANKVCVNSAVACYLNCICFVRRASDVNFIFN